MRPAIHFWTKAPFIRLLVPFVTGIIVQWYAQLPLKTSYIIFTAGIITAFCFFLLPLSRKFRLPFISGLSVYIAFFAIGSLRVWFEDIRHANQWTGSHLENKMSCLALLSETPVKKTKSLKANATIEYLIAGKKNIATKGKAILYFKNDSMLPALHLGSRIMFSKPLQEIQNPGNPGGFDYKRYALFQGITHQAFLSTDDFVLLQKPSKKWLPAFIEKIRQSVLGILREYIPGERQCGLAEALLIGYKNDLDKSLVQSYANTGVVHIIAISGLHLGLIYWLLVGLLKPFNRKKYGAKVCPVIIIAGLWLFSLLAGAQPSILRSAVMFTCIVCGQNTGRKTSIYNTLAFSAFILLCYNPFWLWDLGFQLSYSAVLSIVIFMQPVYHLLYIKNKLIDLFWKMNAVTLAAQVLTIPLSIYHFHQFPTLFLFTNFLAVPLSSVILFAEIILCVVFFTPALAMPLGRLIGWLIDLMNSYIQKIDAIPFSLWNGLQIDLIQSALLYIFIAAISYWLFQKAKAAFRAGLLSLLVFLIVRDVSFWQAYSQKRIIIYNVTRHQAIDLINGRRFTFIGDRDLLTDDFIKNFHLMPSRTRQRLSAEDTAIFLRKEKFLSICRSKIFLADSKISFKPLSKRVGLDLLIISKNAELYLPGLWQTFEIKQIVFDASVPAWKLRNWKRDCDSLHIPYYDVTEKGAFVMNLN